MFPSNLEKEFEENSVTLHGRLSPWGPAYHTRSSLDPAQKREEKTPYRARNVSIQLSCPYLSISNHQHMDKNKALVSVS